MWIFLQFVRETKLGPPPPPPPSLSPCCLQFSVARKAISFISFLNRRLTSFYVSELVCYQIMQGGLFVWKIWTGTIYQLDLRVHHHAVFMLDLENIFLFTCCKTLLILYTIYKILLLYLGKETVNLRLTSIALYKTDVKIGSPKIW